MLRVAVEGRAASLALAKFGKEKTRLNAHNVQKKGAVLEQQLQ